jgi:hypothetical protein
VIEMLVHLFLLFSSVSRLIYTALVPSELVRVFVGRERFLLFRIPRFG